MLGLRIDDDEHDVRRRGGVETICLRRGLQQSPGDPRLEPIPPCRLQRLHVRVDGGIRIALGECFLACVERRLVVELNSHDRLERPSAFIPRCALKCDLPVLNTHDFQARHFQHVVAGLDPQRVGAHGCRECEQCGEHECVEN
jgi:hypothetical protein